MTRPDLSTAIEQRLVAPLRRLRRHMVAYFFIERLTPLAALIVACAAGQFALDWFLRLGPDQRAVINVGLTLVWLAAAFRLLIAPLIRLPDMGELAAAVDRRYPELHDQLATAVQLAQRPPRADHASPALVSAVLTDTLSLCDDLEFTAVLNHRRVARRGGLLAGAALGVVLLFLVFPDLMGVWFRRNWLVQDVPWPQRTRITPQGFDAQASRRWPRGEELAILADVAGRLPPTVRIDWWTPRGARGRADMVIVGENQVRVMLGPLTDETLFRIVGGDERTREYRVIPAERPLVLRLDAEIEPPTYTRLPRVRLEQQTSFDLLRGSRLVIGAQLNQPVRVAELLPREGPALPFELVDPTQARLDWSPPQSAEYTLRLVNTDGWEASQPLRLRLRVTEDGAPELHVEFVGVGRAVTPAAELPLRVRAADLYGLSACSVRLQRNDEPPHALPLAEVTAGAREVTRDVQVFVGAAGVTVGDTLRVWVEARDLAPDAPNTAGSQPRELRVVSAADLLAELAQRELELRREFERHIGTQRAIRDAIERLAQGLESEGATSAAVGQRLLGQMRQQESLAGRCIALGGAFRQILAELRVNHAARPADERRLTDRIADPLALLGAESMSEAVGLMGSLREVWTPDRSAALGRSLDEVQRQMRDILSNMLELEGFREAVALLEALIADQKSIASDTAASLERQLQELLELETDLQAEPESEPNP